MKIILALAATAALGLAGCERSTGTAPQGSDVAAAMPDTTQPRDPNVQMTVPDAGATGAVPADGSAPPVATTPADQPATAPATEAPK
ncbi:MAG: hypothetical protein A2790_01985 [Phenylobacterium sp. RIFCSPHIGHO2_01_FULL_69_31]|jgi:hypothetical protein|uniref:hypothetical protein n=1 Tax=Phenylobacterium sp. RIFCSPHIGHO2_01_FULL_69_31 TaxID=1801944 RepID=UPI0008C97668|nr:hypothetical protein [Phenylobacterium sp. RIFCSPHIGHO2_01_FULL_69_31]OHB31311.1 MAG: hypothetical protein A2790_01985 [Phenylobacterium sp. RIFCSPHIGHO2_01_FULL_69_31]